MKPRLLLFRYRNRLLVISSAALLIVYVALIFIKRHHFGDTSHHCDGISKIDRLSKTSKRPLKTLILALHDSYSHFALHIALANVIASAGHHVHIVFKQTFRHPPAKLPVLNVRVSKAIGLLHPQVFTTFMNLVTNNSKDVVEPLKVIIGNETFVNALRANEYDVGIAETRDPAAFLIFHHVNVRATVATSAWSIRQANLHVLGADTPKNVPDVFGATPSDGLGMSEERQHTVESMHRERFIEYQKHLGKMTKVMKLLTGDTNFPSLDDLLKRSTYYFVNSLRQLDFPRYFPPKVHFFGGIHFENSVARSIANLSKPISDSFNASKYPDGVVLMAFGSKLIHGLAFDAAVLFAQAFAAFPRVLFVVKAVSNKEEKLYDELENVHAANWVDQRGWLASGHVRAFICHCGQNSLLEAGINGVPVLCLPQVGDQPYNAAVVHLRRIGIAYERGKLSSADEIAHAIGQLLGNQTFSFVFEF